MTTTSRPPRRSTALAAALVQGALLAYGVGAVLHGVHAGYDLGSTWVLHWLRDGTLAVPLAALVVAVVAGASSHLSRRGRLGTGSGTAELASCVATALLYAAAVVPAGMVHGAAFSEASRHHHGSSLVDTAVLNASIALLTGLPLLLGARCGRRLLRLRVRPARRDRRSAVALLAGVAVVLTAAPAPASVPADPSTQAEVAACGPASADRRYDVAAVNVRIPYNRWGQDNPYGMVFVLQGDKTAVRNWATPLAETEDKRRLRPRPLVLRANEGECVSVTLTNELDVLQGEGMPTAPRASMAVRGLPFDVQTSAGSKVGYNDDSTVGRGGRITYSWLAPQEGTYYFSDAATTAGSEGDGGSSAHGLYGALVVEPSGSVWRDPRTGNRLYSETGDQSGELYLDAVIDPPTGRTFRETVQLAQDELPLTSTFAFNYGSEPQVKREERMCPDCVGEETSLSSWAYGDPSLVKLASGPGPWLPRTPAGTEDCGLGVPGFDADSCFTGNVTHAYAGDPIKFRFGMAGGKETHVFHLHAHQWLAEDQDVGAAGPTPSAPGPEATPESSTIDSQTFGPNEMFTADLLEGAGGKARTVGDSIFHCHLYPHFANGFWALLRVHDVREDGTGSTPDGVKVSALVPLAEVTGDTGEPPVPPVPTEAQPGFPRFIPGTYGWRAPQPPLGVLDGGVPATRYVAGAPLEGSVDSATVAKLSREQAAMAALSGGRSKPGAPFRDPCPAGAREVRYKVSAIQRDVVYNERGDHDTQGRMLVLDSEVDDVLAGRKAPEPLFARVNAGDCVVWELTNRLPNWFGNDAFQKLTQTNMFGQHIHLVKFDVLASDGSSNGWNYQQAAFSRTQADYNAGNVPDAPPCTASACRLPLPASFDPTTTSLGLEPGQTIVERWYADYELRTVFTHDHHFAAIDQNRGQFGAVVVEPAGVDFRDSRTGAFRQPVNTAGRGAPQCLTSCDATAVGPVLDVIGPGPDDDYRDFGLAIADFVSLTRRGGNPADRADTINPPLEPEHFPDEDPGVMAVNYRNAPLDLRREKNGAAVDPAYAFSSTVFGDPQTPVLQTYAGDNVRIRLIQGSQEEQHQILIHGQKWRKEPNDPQSPMVGAVPVGVSEAFNFEVPRLNCAPGEDCRGDYLYSGASIDDLSTGAWGILRVNGGTVPGLQPLPDNLPTRVGSVPTRSGTALAPPPATGPGAPCPAGAPVRTFPVVAMQAKVTYNEAGDHDPYGLVYALASDAAAIRAGKNPEPLVLRAQEGDCVEVTLSNELTTALQQHTGALDGDARTPGEVAATRRPGLRVSMHPGLLKYDVRGSDGAAVGFNADSTVGPGQSITYRWMADEVTPGEIGAVNLSDYGDVRGQRHHGLLAGLVVEPKGASWHDPVTGRPGASGPLADIRMPGRADFREAVVFYQDGLNLRNAAGEVIEDPSGPPEPGDGPAALDVEDSGEKAFGYRNEPFRHRLGYEPVLAGTRSGSELADVYDSRTHGDPATGLIRSYEGDPLRVRVLSASDKPRQHAFSLAGHGFKPQPDDPDGRAVGTLSGITGGSAVNAEMGVTGVAGDYLYGDELGFFNRSGGLWGLLRNYRRPSSSALLPTAVAAVDDPRAGGHPVLPLELDTVEAEVFDDLDRDGARDRGEPAVAGATVTASAAGAVVSRATSGPDGLAHVSTRSGTYTLEVTAAGRRPVAALAPVTTRGDNDVVRLAVPLTTAPAPAGPAAGSEAPSGGGSAAGPPPAGGGASSGQGVSAGSPEQGPAQPTGSASEASRAPSPSTSPVVSGSASAPAAPAACPGPATVSLDRADITAGQSAVATVRAAAGQAVQLHAYTRPSSTYRLVRSGRTGPDGVVRFDVRPNANTRLLAVEAGCRQGPSVVLAVRAGLSLTASREAPFRYAFRGRALPVRAGGLIVSLYRVTADGRQVLTAQARADARTGVWQLSRRFTGGGTHGFVARTGADMTSAPGSSPIRTVQLR